MAVDPMPIQPAEMGVARAGAVATAAPPATLGANARAARVAIAAVLLVALALNAGLTWRSAAATDRLRSRELDLVRQARILAGGVPELQNAGRGFLLTQDPRFLDDLAQVEAEARAAQARLRELAHSEQGGELVAAIAPQFDAVVAGVRRRVDLARAGRLDEVRAAFVEADADRRRLQADLDDLVGHEERLLVAALDDLQRERVLGLGFGAVLLAAVGLLANRYLAIGGRAVAASESGRRDASEARDRALAALQATMREREALIATISHDLKNPLTTIRGQAQLLGRRVRTLGLPELERVGEGLATIEGSAKKLAGMIDELGDTARLQMGRSLDLRPQPVDLVVLVRQAVAEHGQATDRHRLRFAADGASLVGVWDEARLERVVGNLLSNAVKYSPAGGEVAVRVGREGGDAVIEVRDQGIGIPAGDVPHVFDRYHRAGNVTGAIDGSGLGLAGARQIVEGHGGAIEVTSELGAGSTFTVRLPLGGDEGRGG